MIKVDDLLYGFELRLNELSRQDNTDIPLENKLIFLNDASITWCKQRLGVNNISHAGFEENLKRIEDLNVLKVTNYRLDKYIKSDNKRYLSSIYDLPERLMFISVYCDSTSKGCERTLFVNLITEDELERKYFNVNYSPSFEWTETLGTISNDKLHIYTDGNFTTENGYLTYLRYPHKIDKEGYEHFDGTPSVNRDSELPEYAKQDIIDLAVLVAAGSIKDNQITQETLQRIQINE